MKELLEKTIPGAAFDSSARDPPPRCHPGTRLAILERCRYFIVNCTGEKKIRLVVGAAGVGKSAIMQNVAESPSARVTFQASIFFSINGRNDGTNAIITLSYQLAAKFESYRQFIEHEITRDPSLLQSSMSAHFKKFIIEPFIHHPRLNSVGRILIILDGLDECNSPRSQLEILRLISDFCITHPSSPIVWLIASRPEQHITSFFSRPNVMPTYEKEEIPVDSSEARADTDRFLRDELKGIREASDSLNSQWPEERDLWKLTDASAGLFAYAHAIVRYIGDLNVGNPVSQLSDVLNIIDNHPITDMPREEHPMALLDALYARIMSNVPLKIMIYTRNLLLALASGWDFVLWTRGRTNFVVLCNWLGMTCDEAYAAINHLRSVLRIPRRDKLHEEKLEPFHKSFLDYISDFTRSRFSIDIQLEAQQLKTECAFRILQEAPDGIDFGDVDYKLWYGRLTRGPGKGDKISLTWPVDENVDWSDDETRSSLYKLAIGEVVAGMEREDPTFQSKFCIRLLTTRFKEYYGNFPRYALRDLLFDETRRHEFMMHGLLKKIPLQAIDISTMPDKIKLQFRRPATTVKTSSDPWNSLCEHVRTGKWESGKEQDWKTSFRWYGPLECTFCSERFKNQLENWKVRSPDYTLVILFTSAGKCCVEFQIVHPEDGLSQWRYWIWIKLTLEERLKYGSNCME
ncbi:hypothetical protein AGABI1DRAFT_108438 [Agaricus bisporus var. burnettii JB137-S8]|uniref:NACHT domain-containing protein n=1 Tax=Agaricus bisporus var. burnettii (strain JB137-S8 / ATCC MYA-4627 / FGSC 10392) TaxID=597362 RepID=K5WP54_AGABU|nr:uncharacterized protein AGABI1DRAFT_108438 [Agaricus bisporus var. burnettii JB137-S8]EKM77076.1 hypothetical protein AGABI1DRAFT_108438 [Agaricus bisporus var. burnettii JB137-S8]